MAEQRELLSSALHYAERGWKVFPLHSIHGGNCTCGRTRCDSPGKHPRLVHGLKEASDGAETIKRWWGRWPEANIGLATGSASGVVVFDIDAYKEGDSSLADLEKTLGNLPDTVESLTGGGGRHIFFKHPGDFQIPNRVNLEQGIDVRGDGGYVVVPPSLHVSGNRYSWESSYHPDETSLAEIPEAFLKKITEPKLSERPSTEKMHALDRALVQGVKEGERNDTATRLAGRFTAQGLPPHVVMMILRQWNEKNHPPLEEKELETILDSITKKESLKKKEGDVSGLSREDILQVLSEKFAIPISDIERIGGSNPIYRFHSADKLVEIPAKSIGSQWQWRSAMIMVTEKVPKEVSKKSDAGWNHYLQLMLDVARPIEPGEEATQRGSLRGWVVSYLEVNEIILPEEMSITPDDPRTDEDGGLLLNSSAVRRFLRTEGLNISSQRLAQLFSGEGFRKKVQHFKLPNQDFTTRAMWIVPEGFLPDGMPLRFRKRKR